MTKNWKSATAAFAVTTMLMGTGAQAFAASPEMILKNAETPSKDQVKLPARAAEIVAALEKLEPDLKALTKRSVRAMKDDTNIIILRMEKLFNDDINAEMYFDRTTGEVQYFQTSLEYMKQKEREVASDEIILQRAEMVVQALFGTDMRKKVGDPQLVTKEKDAQKSVEPIGVHANIYYPPLLNGLEVDGVRAGIWLYMGNEGNLIGADYRPLDLKGAKVPDPKTAWSQEAIRKEIFTPDRFYFGYLREGAEGKSKLAYFLRTSPVYDALTGKQVEAKYGTERKDGKSDPDQLRNITLKPQAKPLIVKSEAEAEKLLQSLFGINTKETVFSFRKEVRGEEISYYGVNESGYRFVEIIVDKPTGQVFYVEHVTETAENPVPLTKDQALQKATAVIEPYAEASDWQVEMIEPDKAPLADWMLDSEGKDIGESYNESSEGLYSFHFYELHQGVPILDNFFWVTFDVTTGQVVQLEKTLPIKDLTLPAGKASVTEQQAAEIMAKNVPLKLSYIWPTYYGMKPPSLSLLYTLDTSEGWPIVDAVNGTIEWDE